MIKFFHCFHNSSVFSCCSFLMPKDRPYFGDNKRLSPFIVQINIY
uniref:Uncharacterized protein n=1 Tax=Siphoviridae sp. ct3r22 TaxID=2825325 RepID=A0A8S5V0Y7_9CAUD|nr:MAG TPA: hypothetical protein [Siphoviridae sp. ct3r22]